MIVDVKVFYKEFTGYAPQVFEGIQKEGCNIQKGFLMINTENKETLLALDEISAIETTPSDKEDSK